MRRNSYTLAALAVSAVPGLEPARTIPVATPIDEFDVAGIIGTDGRRVLVTAPTTAAAGAHLEKDVHVTDALAGTSLAPLVTTAIGFARLPEGGRAAVTAPPHGVPVLFDRLGASLRLARSLGEVIARIHAVPAYVAESAGVETFTADALRRGHRARVERAREESGLPATVAQRWDAVLADDDLWDLHPCFVHGALSEEALFRDGEAITGVTGWHEASTGDPAADLAWLVSALDPEHVDALFAAYTAALPVTPHPRTLERAQVLGEFAVVDWLLHGIDSEDEEIIADARGMLDDLDHDLAQLAREEAERRYDDLAAGSRAAETADADDGDDAGWDTEGDQDVDPDRAEEDGDVTIEVEEIEVEVDVEVRAPEEHKAGTAVSDETDGPAVADRDADRNRGPVERGPIER